MWDKYMSPKWREMKTKRFDGTDVVDEEKEKALTDKIRRLVKESLPLENGSLHSDEADQIVMHKTMAARRGKWIRFPPEVINSQKRLLND
jgi:hypothetical protein